MSPNHPFPPPLAYRLVDVFTPTPFGGNSLAVFPGAPELTAAQMLAVTREMRHFESIFLEPPDETHGAEETTVCARVFDLVSELPFAGHPLLGAACVLHSLLAEAAEARGERHDGPAGRTWRFALAARSVRVHTEALDDHGPAGPREPGDGASAPSRFRAVLDQGRPEFLGRIAPRRATELAAALGLTTGELHPTLPLEIVSTGLRYVVVPLVSGLEHARIVRRDFAALLAEHDAEYAYVLDVGDPLRPEGRHWDNDGIMEDVATGSGAGCAAAYLARHGLLPMGRDVVLRQGRFTGRPSEIRLRAEGRPDDVTSVRVGGDVALVGRGTLDALPRAEPRA